MKHTCSILATVLAVALSASAKTFDWPIDATTAGARQFTAYHGETIRFNLLFKGAMTNLAPVCIYYQTNGMAKAEWFGPIPGTVLHPTNDCGAAFYRFFIRCTDPDGVNYTANGSLRMLDSPGFVPNELPLPVKAIDFSIIEVRNAPWATASDLASATNETFHAATNYTDSAIRSATSGLTELGDDRVYEASSLGDFEWSSDRADILAALGSQQPYVGYESGDYVEWYLEFSFGETNYWGYAWAEASARTVTFDIYGYYYHWDDETGDEYYDEDYASVTGTRESQGAVPTGDRYARQSDMTSAQAEMSSIRAMYNGETKVMRDGGEGQCGYGWGYLQHPLSGEARYWRIRVPKWTAFPGAATNAMTCVNQWGEFPIDPVTHVSPDRAVNPYNTNQVLTVTPVNPASWLPSWGVRRTLSRTRGVNGSDAVAMADWDLGFSFLSTNTDRCAVNFLVTQTASSPMSYSVAPDVRGMLPVDVISAGNVTNTWYARYVDFNPETRQWYYGASPIYRNVQVTVDVKGFLVDPSRADVTTNGTLSATWYTLFDMSYRVASSTGSSATNYSAAVSFTNCLVGFTATATCSSLATLEDVRVPYYRLVTSLDGHLYYDAALDETYRVVSSNGVFFSEWHCEGDWRREGL